jgi:hypothetical protein
MLAIYVCRVGRRRNALGSLVGRRWETVVRACGDLVLALGCFVMIEASDALWATYISHGHASPYAFLPHTAVERLMWVCVSLTVGVSEEIVYRGYLQTQLAAFSGHAVVGVFLQATLFAIAHAQQGAAAIVRVGFYGLLFGALAQWRGSLLPGMMCHVAIDVVGGM